MLCCVEVNSREIGRSRVTSRPTYSYWDDVGDLERRRDSVEEAKSTVRTHFARFSVVRVFVADEDSDDDRAAYREVCILNSNEQVECAAWVFTLG